MRIALGRPLTLDTIPAVSPRLGVTAYGIATDSREVKSGDLFIAYNGEHHRGIAFADQAFANGAVAVLGEGEAKKDRILTVPSLTDCIASLASAYLQAQTAKRIAVTGSVGKTTTVACISAMLGRHLRVHAPCGNHNTDIGLPLTALSMPPKTDALILELGARRAGEIAHLSKIARPHFGMITGIGSSHLETFGTKEAILAAKTEIVCGMSKESLLLLNADDPMLTPYRESCPVPTLAISPGNSPYTSALIQMNRPLRYAAAFAAAVAELLGFSETQIEEILPELALPPMRLEKIEQNGFLYLMDAYNASPESAYAALEALRSYQNEKRKLFALFADMQELGEAEARLHRQVGRACAETGLSHLFCYGKLAEEIAAGALESGMEQGKVSFYNFGEEEMLIHALRASLRGQAALLLKGSRKAKLENILKRLV